MDPSMLEMEFEKILDEKAFLSQFIAFYLTKYGTLYEDELPFREIVNGDETLEEDGQELIYFTNEANNEPNDILILTEEGIFMLSDEDMGFNYVPSAVDGNKNLFFSKIDEYLKDKIERLRFLNEKTSFLVSLMSFDQTSVIN